MLKTLDYFRVNQSQPRTQSLSSPLTNGWDRKRATLESSRRPEIPDVWLNYTDMHMHVQLTNTWLNRLTVVLLLYIPIVF